MMKRLCIGGVSLLVLILAGCKEKDPYTLRFGHGLHVKDNGMACADCHGAVRNGAYSRPGHDVCGSCHESEVTAGEISEKTCGLCHKQKDLKAIDKTYAAVKKAPAGERLFTHTAALTNDCLSCHETLMDAKSDRVPPMGHDDVIRIRQQAHQGGKSCDDCHTGMSPQVAPADHQKDWRRRHGEDAGESDSVCSVCHQEETCRECHQANKPASHGNNLWRTKTHGVEASWERAKCQVCHQEDSCSSCHAEMRPRSHNAAWRRNHCEECHTSQSRGTGCETCHRGGLEAHPNPHEAGWARRHCDTCHSGSAEGRQCDLCHPNAVESHPNPHGAGWQQQHCDQCHETPEGAECGICHYSTLENHSNPHGAGWLDQHCDECHADGSGGDDCGMCHEGVSAHPNPHGAGWQQQHCDACHPGTPEGDQCAICHETTTHSSPHMAGWRNGHCESCHAAGPSANCEDCHTGGDAGLSVIHGGVWPEWHSSGGYNDSTDCFESGCHDTGLRLRRSKGKGPRAQPERWPARYRK